MRVKASCRFMACPYKKVDQDTDYTDHDCHNQYASPVEHTYFIGYCNGYYSYFPTIQSAAEGGYGASWGLIAAAGTGERFLDQALIGLYQLLGQL